MIALKIFGIVIGALILLIGAICFIPVSLRLTSTADERLGYKLYVLGIPINIDKIVKKKNAKSSAADNKKDEEENKVKSKQLCKASVQEHPCSTWAYFPLAQASPDSIVWRTLIPHAEGKQSGLTVIDPPQ